jgi:hypothetical protein
MKSEKKKKKNRAYKKQASLGEPCKPWFKLSNLQSV